MMKKLVIPVLLSISCFALANETKEYCVTPVTKCTEGMGIVLKKREGTLKPCSYSMSIGDSKIAPLNSEQDTIIKTNTEKPMVKVYQNSKLVKSFTISDPEMDCIYFKKQYESWSLYDSSNAKGICTCQ